MKLQLEISNKEKIVRIEEATNVGELYDFLQAHFPNDTWKEFKLEVKTVIQWQNPIIIEKQVEREMFPYPHPIYPQPSWIQPWWTHPTIICDGVPATITSDYNFKDCKLSTGTYCVQVK